jgi:hypothetical protein
VAKSVRDGWLSGEGWVANSVARQLATAALWVRIETSLKYHKLATKAREWLTYSSPPNIFTKNRFIFRPSDSTVSYAGIEPGTVAFFGIGRQML